MKKSILIVFLLILVGNSSKAEDGGLNIFGSAQSTFLIDNRKEENLKPKKETMLDTSRSAFSLQQLDLFLQKNITDNFSFFTDIQARMNYSSEKNTGGLSIEEAWINYSFKDFVNIKFGMLYPEFNNLNPIKNRLNLMPYITRPIIYEQTLSTVYSIEDFIPDKAFLQIYGFLPATVISNSINFEYALYMGNSENSYISTNTNNNRNKDYILGTDTKNFKTKLYGARIGLKSTDEKFKLGFSLNHDYDNRRDTSFFMITKMPSLGDVPRWRYGADLTLKVAGFELNHETVIVSYYDYNKKLADTSFNSSDIDLGQFFTYTTLLYNFNDDIFAYLSQCSINDNFMQQKANLYSLGGGYKFTSDITGKMQYYYYDQKLDDKRMGFKAEYKLSVFQLGVSINF